MQAPATQDLSHLVGRQDEGKERLFAELQVVRRRLEQVVLTLHDVTRTSANGEEWRSVHETAQTALRSLQAALAAVPTLPFAESLVVPNEIAADDLTIAVAERRAWYVDREVTLSNTEFALLVALARQPERVYTKAELLRDVWGYRSLGRTRTLDSFASRLRRKLQASGAPGGRYVVCVWGVGYSLIRP